MNKGGALVLLVLVLTTLAVMPVSAKQDPGPVRFTVIKDFPEVMYAGGTYEAEYGLENLANRPVPFTFNMVVDGPDLEEGEFKVTMVLDGVDLDVYEARPGEFRPKDIQWLELEPKAEKSLVVGVTSVQNLMPSEYTLTVELRILVGKILMAMGHVTTHVDAIDEAGVDLNFTPGEEAVIAVVDLEGNPYPEARPPGRGLGRYFDVSTDAEEFTATIRVYYTDEDVRAAGVDEDTLRLYYFDGTSWVMCDETGVDTEENYVWARVTHFTAFAAFGALKRVPTPPPSIGDLTPPTISDTRPTGSVNTTTPTISAKYSDTVGIDIDSVRLILDGVDVTEWANVAPEGVSYVPEPLANNTTHVVELTVADTSGNEASLEWNFTVLLVPPPPPAPKAAEFVISDLSIMPGEAEVGDEVTVSVLVTNVGEQPGSHVITMRANGLENVAEVTLDSGESERVEFTIIPPAEGTYSIEVDGLTGILEVKAPPAPPKPAEFRVSGLEISPDKVEEGGEVTVTVTVANVGEEHGSHTVILEVDGRIMEKDVALDGGASEEVSFTFTMAVEGTYSVKVDGLSSIITVLAAPPARPAWMRPGYVAGILIIVASAAAMAYSLIRRRMN